MVRIKVCGISQERDAMEVALLGVDALGFVLDGGPSGIEPDEVAALGEKLPPLLARIGVFLAVPPRGVKAAAAAAGTPVVQVAASAAAAKPGERPVRGEPARIATVTVRAGFDPASLGGIRAGAFRLVLERRTPASDAPGLPASWNLARASGRWGRVILGGLSEPEDLEEAIGYIRPYGVDLSEGTEFAPGQKDIDRLEAALQAVRRAGARLAAEREWSR